MLGSNILVRRKGPVPAPLPRPVQQSTTAQVMPLIDERTARGVSAYRRGQRLIARTIGVMPMMMERNGVLMDAIPPLLQRPVPWMDRQAAIESTVETLIDYGNYFALWTQFDQAGRAQGIIPIHPRDVWVALTPAGLLYRIGDRIYSSSDVMHIRTGAPAGEILGWGVLETSSRAVDTGVSVGSAANYFYRDGIYPTGVLEVEDENLSEDDAEELRQKWVRRTKRNEPNVLPAGTTWKAVVTPNAEQAQIAQAANMSRREIADILDLDGDWLGVPSESLTYANIVDRADHLLRFTASPWMASIEDAYSEQTTRPTRVRFQPDELLRGQTGQRYSNYQVGLASGFLTIDEVRSSEGLQPLPPPVSMPVRPQPEEGIPG